MMLALNWKFAFEYQISFVTRIRNKKIIPCNLTIALVVPFDENLDGFS